MPGTVVVGCKLPSGLVMQLFDMVEVDRPLANGAIAKAKEARPAAAPVVRLNGSARYQTKDPDHVIVAGAGLTPDVDADFFHEWMKRNADMEIVKNGTIFAHAKQSEVEAQARDKKSVQTGFERINPDALPPEFKGKISTAERPK